ncbi:MAG: MgtC/SapB family protein [Candidatus Omnitrophota bacterium]
MFNSLQVIIRLSLAFIIGGLIGFERELHGRAAGLRTHILVCLGSTLIMLTSIHVFQMYEKAAQTDPSRIAAGIVTGIGFLGAGTILRFKASVRGLTTAASLWATAGIGMAIGSGFYSGAYAASAIVLFTLFFLTKLEKAFVRKDWYKVLLVQTRGHARQMRDIRAVLSEYKAEIKDLEINKKANSKDVIVELTLKLLTDRQDDQIITDIMRIEGVESSGWQET